ncbi:hypothetical protein [Gelidibacter maritimus]|uniref:Uncharacterized protein n=1 Tax=Gelidibacter maritimus TaxID=2761487 RepID=A0A7W2M900_9FLAO|nr:hypothetical protein [Gelidibacter maritimus]MBA6154890.1 hypothetical protein [Gelidibacter maritimus]
MTSEKYNALGKGTALISFIIGALIFGIYFLTSNSDLLFIGYGFVVLAGITNLIILIAILAKSNSDSTNRKRLLKTSGLMLINLPIMFLFIWLSLILIGNMRITFTNSTQNKLTDIKIDGCETEYISELKPNESKTVWVGITGDCSITLEYLENGELKKEMVAGYVTNGMGQKMKHKIDGKDKDIL